MCRDLPVLVDSMGVVPTGGRTDGIRASAIYDPLKQGLVGPHGDWCYFVASLLGPLAARISTEKEGSISELD